MMERNSLQDRLEAAVQDGDVAAVRTLLESGADPNAGNEEGATAVHAAARGSSPDCLRVLLEAGGSPDGRTGEGCSSWLEAPLVSAAFKGRADMALALVEAGADVNVKAGNRETPLHWSVQDAEGVLTRRLLEAGADPNARNLMGETPLHAAAWVGNADGIRILVEAGATVDAEDDEGMSPLACASMGASGCVRALLAAGADAGAKAGPGRTALVRACWHGLEDNVRMLLEAGADPDGVGDSAESPLHAAAWDGNPAIVGMLLQAGADPGVTASGRAGTPGEWARARDNGEAAALLGEALGSDREQGRCGPEA